MNKYIILLLSFFNIGKVKVAPGTFASGIAAFTWYFIPNIVFLQILIIFSLLILGFWSCYIYSIQNYKQDPGFIVIDEIAGMSIALFMVPKFSILFIIAFIIFRVFDIFKPSIIYHSEKIDYGLGIMLDDIISGVLVLLIIQSYIQV